MCGDGWSVRLGGPFTHSKQKAGFRHVLAYAFAFPFAGINGLKMLGISHDAVVFLIEQLYGAKRCKNYSFKFHKHQEVDELPINPHGSARAEIHQR